MPALRRGELGAPLHVDAHVIALPRRLGDDFVVTVTNNAATPQRIALRLPSGVGTRFVDRLDGSEVDAVDGLLTLTVPARWGRVLQVRARPR